MKIELELAERKDEADRVRSFLFQPRGEFPYQAGQHLRLTVPHPEPDNRGASRYFTISSAPSEPFVSVTTRLSEPGSSFKRALDGLPSGSVVEASGPGGRFTYAGDQPAVFIAGGIGITPFRSILTELARQDGPADVVLLYANRDPDFPFRAQLDDLAGSRPGVRVVYTVTRPAADWHGPVGRIDAAFLARVVPDLAARTAYASGPRPMVEAAVAALTLLGVEPTAIKQEIFPGYDS